MYDPHDSDDSAESSSLEPAFAATDDAWGSCDDSFSSSDWSSSSWD